jgi:hypothetical protein
MKSLCRAGLVLVLIATAICASSASAAPRHPDVKSLSRNSREIFRTAMEWADKYYDPQAKLTSAPPSLLNAEFHSVGSHTMVRESSWYALGLLLRDGKGDRDRAADILRVVLAQQYHEPGKVWDGTFRRTPAEPEPAADAVMWRAYDPNWREFVGSTLAIILLEYPDRIPAELKPRMIQAIDDAVAGETKQGRLAPTYTNPALMYGFLWAFAAERGGKPEWKADAQKWQDTVYGLYKQHDAFFEYNSPTYAGVDVFALALWRDYGFSKQMRERGAEMEAGLWRATADLYNANLRNIAGPYDRSYGMDMQSYVSVMGVWLRTVLDAGHAPLTGFDNPPVDHVDDLFFVPPIVVLDTQIPADAMKSFTSFQGEHEVRRPIADERVATAWIGKELIYGGEITGHTKDVGAASQFHPVTVQWQAPGKVGWIQLTRCPMIDAAASKKGIVISANGDVSFRISAPGVAAAQAKSGEWTLPGLTVHVETDAKDFTATQQGPFVDVKYSAMTMMTLTFAKSGE